jgi:AraC-like DNA-binding protein
MRPPHPSADRTFEALANSQLFADYRRAFESVTGVPLSITRPGETEAPSLGYEHVPEFCQVMSKLKPTLAACCEAHHQAHKAGEGDAWTFTCFAGICEAIVPVRIGGAVMAWLRPGRAMNHVPKASEFGKVARMFSGWDPALHLTAARDAWLRTRVLPTQQYEALIGLLVIFSKHLSACVPLVGQTDTTHEHESIERARLFITKRFHEKLTLAAAARVACMSPHYFSGRFKAVTGMGFVEYLTRMRVEKACALLRDSHNSITDIAFDVGFRSLSQFNRTFRQLMNQSPTNYRSSCRMAI